MLLPLVICNCHRPLVNIPCRRLRGIWGLRVPRPKMPPVETGELAKSSKVTELVVKPTLENKRICVPSGAINTAVRPGSLEWLMSNAS